MENSGPAVDPTTLLAHTDWMRGLAQHLVHDESLADDIAQEAASIALATGDSVRTARPWLQTVVRNLARRSFRDRSRRSRREQIAARPESLSVDDTVERAELHSQLTSWVLELEEPYRSTLLLRFFDDSSPKEIAERLDVPSSTVRVWLSRGLARIRTRLDQQHGGRSAWSVMLVHTFGLERNAATSVAASAASTGAVSWWSLGGWIMTVKNWSIVAPLVLLLVGGGVALKIATGENPKDPESVVAHAPAASVIDNEGADEASAAPPPTHATDEATTERASSGLASVSGIVVDLEEQPVPNITLRMIDVRRGTEITRVESGADGTFAFSTSPGVLDVLTDDPQWSLAFFQRLRIEREGGNLKIQVARAATLCGWVSEQGTEEPIPGAWVGAYFLDRLVREGVADSEGRFCLDGLMAQPNDLKIATRADGYVRVARIYQPRVQLAPGETREDFRLSLQPGVPITGRVVDVEGRGVANATVHCRTLLDPHSTDIPTNADGSFRFSLPLGSRYSFWAEAGERGTKPILDVDLTEEGLSIGDWVAATGATVEGRFVDELGEPLTNCRVHTQLTGTDSRRSATTDADGRVRLTDLLPGMHRFLVTVAGTSLSPENQAELRVDHAEHLTDREFVVRVDWRHRISGRAVTAHGEPAVRESVRIQRGQEMTFTQTGDDGAFTAVGLVDADYQVTIGEETRTIAAGTTDLEWSLPDEREQSVTIRVVDGRTGNPVTYFSHSVNRGPRTSRIPARNHRDGVLDLQRSADQLLVVQVNSAEFGEGELRIEATENVDPLHRELVLRSVAVVKGRVVDPSGNPVAEAWIRERADSSSPVVARTRADGSFEYRGGDVSVLYVSHRRYSLERIDVRKGEENLVVVTPLASVTGRVSIGHRAFEGKIVARIAEQSIRTTSNASGEFELDVPPTEAIVAFEVETRSGSVEIQKVFDFRKETDLTIRLPRLEARLEGQILNAPGGASAIEFVVQTSGDFTVREQWPIERNERFTLPDLPAGELTVRAIDRGMPKGQSQFFSLTAGTNSIRVDFAPAQGSFAGRVGNRADHESLMFILWNGEIEIDLESITMADVARLQASASRAVRLDQKDSFEVNDLAPGLYTYWLLAADAKNPPRSIEDFRTKVRSKIGTVQVPRTEGEVLITLPEE